MATISGLSSTDISLLVSTLINRAVIQGFQLNAGQVHPQPSQPRQDPSDIVTLSHQALQLSRTTISQPTVRNTT